MEGNFFKEKFIQNGIEIVLPSQEERAFLENRISQNWSWASLPLIPRQACCRLLNI
jgi:aspartate/glutamate racemase